MPWHFAQFIALRPSPGVVIVSQELDVGAGIEDLLLIWAAKSVEEWVGKIGFLPL